jgi:hypothetical protein
VFVQKNVAVTCLSKVLSEAEIERERERENRCCEMHGVVTRPMGSSRVDEQICSPHEGRSVQSDMDVHPLVVLQAQASTLAGACRGILLGSIAHR